MGVLAVGSEVAGCRIEAVAGEGGMGVVYVATQLALRRRVALKVIAPDLARDPNFRERFKRESLLAASIEHPNVIPVYEAGEREGLLYLVMRYVEGTDLRALIEREGALEAGRAGRLLSQVAAALGSAHRQGLVHRDVKPANVLVVPGEDHEHAYITDFGIAREMAATSAVTRTGAVVGTIDYLAPERFEGDRGDARSDVYAFGCMLFEALTGDIPFPRDSNVAKMLAHANAPPPSLAEVRPEVPTVLAEVVERCMAKDPAARYADGAELARATAAAAASAPPGAAPAPSEAARGAPRAASPPLAVSGPPTAASAEARPAPEVTPPPLATPSEGESPAAEPPDEGTESLDERRKPLPVARLAGLFAAVIGAVALIFVLGGRGDEGGEGGGSGKERASGGGLASTRVPRGPDGLTVVDGKVWTASAGAGTLTPIDAGSGEAGPSVRVGDNPDSVTGSAGSVWVTNTGDGTVSRVDSASGEVQGGPIGVGRQPEGIASGSGAIWVANAGDGTLTRIEASSGRPTTTREVGGAPIGVAAAPDDIWVTDSEGGTLVRVDPASGARRGEPIKVGAEPRGVAVSAGEVWVANSADGSVTRIDSASGRPNGDPIRVGGNPREVAAEGEGVWVTLSERGQAVRIDRSGRLVERVKVGRQPVGVAVGAGHVWVAVLGEDRVAAIQR